MNTKMRKYYKVFEDVRLKTRKNLYYSSFSLNADVIKFIISHRINLNDKKVLCVCDGEGLLSSMLSYIFNCHVYNNDITINIHKKFKQSDHYKIAKKLNVLNNITFLGCDVKKKSNINLLYNLEYDFIFCVRGCGQLTDIAMELAFKKKIPIIIMPCSCDTEYDHKKYLQKQVLHNKNDYDFVNNMRIDRALQHNYSIIMKKSDYIFYFKPQVKINNDIIYNKLKFRKISIPKENIIEKLNKK